MVVSMGRGVGDGKVVDGGVISGTVIYDMVASRRDDIGDRRMTSGAITSNIMGTRRGYVSDDDEVTCGIVVSSREGRGNSRLVDSGVVSSVVTSSIMASMGGNTGDSRVVSNTTCSKGKSLGESDGMGEGGSVQALGANGVDDVDNANMVSIECIYRRGCRPTYPPSRLLSLLRP